MADLLYTARGAWGFECVLEADERSLTATRPNAMDNATRTLAPVELDGDQGFGRNAALVTSLVGYATAEHLRRRSRSLRKTKSYERERDRFHRDATFIAPLVAKTFEGGARFEWCSCCFRETAHHPRKLNVTTTVYLCQSCGAPTSPCAAPRCRHMARRGSSTSPTPKYCAEHRHEIPDFGRMDERLKSLEDVDDWLKFSKTNIPRTTKMLAGAVAAGALLAPIALVAAPAVGGALGTALSGGTLYGAAASSHGLAVLGGGTLAANGLGMAGGTWVVTATGAALGSAVGATTTSAYVRSDKSFAIEKLQDGTGPAVIVASGFLTEKSDGWGTWEHMLEAAFPDRPIFRVRWGAKELKAVGVLLGSGGAKAMGTTALKTAGAKASKAAAKLLGPVATVLIAADVAANPWTVARTRADMTGAALADILARTDQGPFTLVGHSLGARVMAEAAVTLGTRSERAIVDVHLMGAAMSQKKDWRPLAEAVQGTVFNYWSDQDTVLRRLYRLAELGSVPVGLKGFDLVYPKMKNVNLSRKVSRHSGYFDLTPLITRG